MHEENCRKNSLKNLRSFVQSMYSDMQVVHTCISRTAQCYNGNAATLCKRLCGFSPWPYYIKDLQTSF